MNDEAGCVLMDLTLVELASMAEETAQELSSQYDGVSVEYLLARLLIEVQDG